jgi:aryl-alcohol dehydrogenase-like predicted oxidoreductase
MQSRNIGGRSVPAIGLGCMNLSHAYGVPPSREQAERVLQCALDLGITHFDSAALYGASKNEALVGPFLKSVRDQIFLVSKGVLFVRDGKRTLDGHPEQIRRSCEESLARMRTEVIDLYYLHRLDPQVPIEESVGAVADLIEQGKVNALGLSEMSADTIRRAHAEHTVSAVQSEYSLWSRNVEIGVLGACEEIGAAFVAFSPLARGFLANMKIDPREFVEKDIRIAMPRFQEPHFSLNRKNLLAEYQAIAEEIDCTPAQLALAWLLHQSENMHVIPGTTSALHLKENWKAGELHLPQQVINKLDQLINQNTVSGPRYSPSVQAQVGTEEFPVI